MLIWIFLSCVLALWLAFGTVQDIRQREIANWVTLSLIGIGIITRLLFSIETREWTFFLIGAIMTLIFVAASFAFYYTKVFAGGDAKLLMGLGAFIPGDTYTQAIFNGLSAILVLLVVGAAYSLAYSGVIASRNRERFKKEMKSRAYLYYFLAPMSAVIILAALKTEDGLITFLGILIAISMLLYPYFLSVDKCMIRIYGPSELTPGDWLQQDVLVNGKKIKSTVHGLSEKEIALLMKYRKNVLVKEGIPFVPVFFITYIIMVCVFVSGLNLPAALF